MEICMQNLESLIFLVKTAVKFKNLQIIKFHNTNINNFLSIPFELMYISLRYTQFAKQFLSKQIQLLVLDESKFSLTNAFDFSKWKVLPSNIYERRNKVKILGYSQVFWVEVPPLENKYSSFVFLFFPIFLFLYFYFFLFYLFIYLFCCLLHFW